MERVSGLATLWKAGLDNWQHFTLALSFPILLYLSFVAESLFGTLRSPRVVWVDLGITSVLMLAGIVGVVPYRRRKVTIGQTFFWILLLPVLIFLLLALLPFRFPVTITDIPMGPSRG
jgi:hypothetical protein